MLLVGTFSNKAQAVMEFNKLFGEYYGQGVEVRDGINFDFPDADLLVSPAMEEALAEWTATPEQMPYLQWYTSMHYNFS